MQSLAARSRSLSKRKAMRLFLQCIEPIEGALKVDWGLGHSDFPNNLEVIREREKAVQVQRRGQAGKSDTLDLVIFAVMIEDIETALKN